MKFFTISKLFLLLTLVQPALQAQSLVSLNGNLSFAPTNELQARTQNLSLFNPNSYPITIDEVDRFSFYGDKVFSVSDSQFTVMPGDTFNLSVSFLPEHNVQHTQALVFKSNSGFGHTVVDVSGQGTYSRSYYSTTQNKDQEALKNALDTRLAQGYIDLGYTGARDQMYASIDNNGGQVECVYTGRTATFNTRAGANSNSFNTEHTFPQGFFNSNVPMRSDIHHLFPTDVTANSRRGNDPFGMVSSASWSQGGSKSGGGKFEPRDSHKGAVARAMMYFVIRYQDYSNHFSGQENILRQWHDQFPPSVDERARNQAIYNLQNNRNPFVDYPQFIERISDIDGVASSLDSYGLYWSDNQIDLAFGPNLNRFYTFVFYNPGNQAMTIQNFSLSDPDLSFRNGNPGSIILNAGDSYALDINYLANKSYSATLDFEGSANVGMQSIPISSGINLGSDEIEESQPQFYPNPNRGELLVNDHHSITDLQLVDLTGRVFDLKPQAKIDLSSFKKGSYILRYRLGEWAQWRQDVIILQ